MRFVVDKSTAGRMDRVVKVHKGEIVEKKIDSRGVVYHVVRL